MAQKGTIFCINFFPPLFTFISRGDKINLCKDVLMYCLSYSYLTSLDSRWCGCAWCDNRFLSFLLSAFPIFRRRSSSDSVLLKIVRSQLSFGFRFPFSSFSSLQFSTRYPSHILHLRRFVTSRFFSTLRLFVVSKGKIILEKKNSLLFSLSVRIGNCIFTSNFKFVSLVSLE